MKKYSEFIKKDLKEGFIGNIIGKAASFINGSKQKISDKLSKMEEIEKSYIDKSDEMNYNIFSSEFKKNQDPVESISSKQKALMNKRAIDALKIAKNSEINLLIKEINIICNGDQLLISFYNKERSQANVRISKYAYDKAKRFNDSSYDEQFYNQWRHLEQESEKIKYNNDEDIETDDSGKSMGIFDLPIKQFVNEISVLPKADIATLINDGGEFKIELGRRYRLQYMNLKRDKSRYYRRGDIESHKITSEEMDKIYDINKKAVLDLDNKIAVLKNRLRNTKA